MTAPVVLRSRAALTAELDALTSMTESGSPFHQGARDALRWLLAGGFGPLTGVRTDPPLSMRAVTAELGAADTLLCRRQSAGRDYAAGLEHAIMWAESAGPAKPSQVHASAGRSGRLRSRDSSSG